MFTEQERYFLFTDIEGSTPLWERFPVAMQTALARHDSLLRTAAEANEGRVFKTIGDAFCIAFPTLPDALRGAVQAHQALYAQDWGQVGTVRVRLAIHGGTVQERDGDYFGTPLNRVARLRDAGHGGQLLISGHLRPLVTEPEFETLQWLDLGNHRLRGLEEPEPIFQLVLPGLPAEFPPLKTESAHPHNLPSETTSFVGRRPDIIQIRNLLIEKKARLVTLTGLGGSGKSRLAIRAASDILWRYPDGIWYVDAVSLSHVEEFSSTLLHACGLTEDSKKTALQQLSEHFKSSKALLLVDGAERFEELADDIAVLIKGTEHLQVLATSRSVLYLSMEHEVGIEPLTLAESRELFVERAQQARPEFSLTAETEPILDTLCQTLEGVPLSIELAAAQVRLHALPELQDALSKRFELLATRLRDIHPRHRSLRSTIDWSYQSLTPEEQALFRSLSCFAGSFSTEAATAVCGPLSQKNLLTETLGRLRDKSLLRLAAAQHSTSTEPVRYLLQDSLREFGADALRETEPPPQQELLFSRHSQYYQSLVQERAQELRGAGQRAALSALERDAANIRAVQERLLSKGEVGDAARLAIHLWRFWEIRGWLREGRAQVQRLLQRESALDEPRTLAELLLTAGRLEWNGADAAKAIGYLQRSVDLCSQHPEPEFQLTQRTALTVLGMIAYSRGDLLTSDQHYEAALAVPSEDMSVSMALKTNLGINAMARGENERALQLFEECLAYRQRVGDMVREAHAWNCIGATSAALGQVERAIAAFEKSHQMYEALGDPVHAAHAQLNLGDLAGQSGDHAHAQQHFEEALVVLRPLEEWRGITACQLGRAVLALHQEELAVAQALAQEALQISQQNGYQESVAQAQELLALTAFVTGQQDAARDYLQRAEALRDEIQLPRSSAQEVLLAPLLQQRTS